MKSRKRQITEGTEVPYPERIRTLGEKGNYKCLEILSTISRHHQTSNGERKDKKKILQMNEKVSRNQNLQQKGMNTCIVLTLLVPILKMDKGVTQANGPKDKKVDDDAKGVTSD